MSRLLGFLNDGVTVTDRRRIVRGTMYAFLIQGISIVLVFVSNWWLVRHTFTIAYGVYVNIFNWVSILAVLVLGGRDDLVLAQLPKYIAAGQRSRVLRLVKAANGWLFLSALFICGGFLLVIAVVPIRSLSDLRPYFVIAMPAVYFTAFLGLNQVILQALNHIRLSMVVERIARPLLLIAFIELFRWWEPHLDDSRLLYLVTGVSGVCFILIGAMVYRKMRSFKGAVAPPAEGPVTEAAAGAGAADPLPERHGRKTGWFFLISVLNLLTTKVTMLLMPFLLVFLQDIGTFNIAYRYADVLIFPFFLMHAVLPQLFARHTPEEKEYTRSLFKESTKLMTVLAIPLLLLNLFAGHFLLRLFGAYYEQGYMALVYISLAQFLFSFFGPANTILMTQGREKYSAYCLLVYVVVLILTSWWLLSVAYLTGGALAVLISSAVYNGLLAIVVYRSYGIITPFLSFLVKRR